MDCYPSMDYLCALALDAGKIIKEHFARSGIEWKEDKTPLTIADTLVNKKVIESISKDFPFVSIISEEGNSEVKNAKYSIVCDPVDGTFPFIWDIPIMSFCIAVLEEDVPILGVIYDPFGHRVWHAEKSKGAFLNGVPIEVSQRDSLDGSSVCMIWWKRAGYNLHEVCSKLMDVGANWFNPASIAYPGGLLAMGKIDATIFPGRKNWETAAMQVIAEEAGGEVTDILGNKMVYSPDGKIAGHIISNGLIHDQLVDLVRSCQ